MSPAASAGSAVFASRLYGYDLVVPSGWDTQPAESTWVTVGLEGRCPSDWDCFSGSSGEPTLAAAAASVPEDQTLDQWRMRMQVGLPEGCMDSAQTAATMLGGAPAETWTTTCEGEGLHATKVVALHAGRGYMLLFASPISLGLEADRATLSSILTTFHSSPPDRAPRMVEPLELSAWTSEASSGRSPAPGGSSSASPTNCDRRRERRRHG